ncbi:MAG: UDP-N-acetylglucosamine 2-epimerase [Caldilineaceae bacterium]
MMQKYCFVFSARAEIVKFTPLVDEFKQHNVNFFTVYTGPHPASEMKDVLMRELDIPAPDYFLQHASWVFNVMDGVQQLAAILRFEQPHVVLVQDEANSTLVATLAAKAVGLHVLHFKTGPRSGKTFTGEAQNALPIAMGARSADGYQPAAYSEIR